MKEASMSRKCGKCKRVVVRFIPDHSILGIQICNSEKVRDFRYVKENPDGSGHYYCMDCLKKMFPNKY